MNIKYNNSIQTYETKEISIETGQNSYYRSRQHRHTMVARAVRSLGVYSEIYPHDITSEQLSAIPGVRGVILNGGENRVVDGKSVDIAPELYDIGIPMLAVDHPTARCANRLDHLAGG